jgi:SmpA/OmlA family protein
VKGAGVVLAVVLTVAACASTGSAVLEQRTTQGPQAEELWGYRVTLANGREPTFEERTHWERQLDAAISRYLAKDQEYANSPNVLTFRSVRQVEVGMSKEQVVILLGAPQRTTTDAGEIEKLAGKYWPDVQTQVTEAWVYPMGWRLYFAGVRLVDITQYQTR